MRRLLRPVGASRCRIRSASLGAAAPRRGLSRVLPAIGLAAILMLGVAAIIFVPLLLSPELADRQAQFESRDRARLTDAAIVAGIVAALGAYVNWRRVSALEQQVVTAQLSQVTERFSRAVRH